MPYVQSVEGTDTGATTVSLSSVTADSTLLVFASLNSESITLTCSDDNSGAYQTLLGPIDHSTATRRSYCFIAHVVNSGTTQITVTPSSGTPTIDVIAVEHSGVHGVEDTATAESAGGMSHASDACIPVEDTSDLVCALFATANIGVTTESTGFSEREENTRRYLQTLDNAGAINHRPSAITTTNSVATQQLWVSLRQITHVGFGSTTGGHADDPGGYSVYRVTSLADTGAAGTFRDAVSAGGRYIVFDVGGTITLGSNLTINNDYLTIAGETAPSPGITFDHGTDPSSYYISIRGTSSKDTHDIIVRYIRSTSAGGHPNNDSDLWSTDGTTQAGSGPGSHPEVYNLVYDHLTLNAGEDGAPDFFNNSRDITLSNCFMHLTSHVCIINGAAGQQTERRNISLANNIWMGKIRQPRIRNHARTIDIVNNIMYGWGRDLSPPDASAFGLSIEETSTSTPASYPGDINVEGCIFHYLSSLPYGTEDDAINFDHTDVNIGDVYFDSNIVPPGETNEVTTGPRTAIAGYAQVTVRPHAETATHALRFVGTHYRLSAETDDLESMYGDLGFILSDAATLTLTSTAPTITITPGVPDLGPHERTPAAAQLTLSGTVVEYSIPGLTHAVSGVAIIGHTIVGDQTGQIDYFEDTTQVTIRGVDVTAMVDWDEFEIIQGLSSDPSTCTVVLASQGTFVPEWGNELEVWQGGVDAGVALFGGTILAIDTSIRRKDDERVWTLSAIDYRWMMDRTSRVTGKFTNIGINTLVARLIADYTDSATGIQYGAVDQSLGDIDQITFRDETLCGALTTIADAATAYWTISPTKRISMFQSSNVTGTTHDLDSDGQVAVQIERDASQAQPRVIHHRVDVTETVNDVLVLGASTQLTADVASGSLDIPIDDGSIFPSDGFLYIEGEYYSYGVQVIPPGPATIRLAGAFSPTTRDHYQGDDVFVAWRQVDSTQQDVFSTRFGSGQSGVIQHVVRSSARGEFVRLLASTTLEQMKQPRVTLTLDYVPLASLHSYRDVLEHALPIVPGRLLFYSTLNANDVTEELATLTIRRVVLTPHARRPENGAPVFRRTVTADSGVTHLHDIIIRGLN